MSPIICVDAGRGVRKTEVIYFTDQKIPLNWYEQNTYQFKNPYLQKSNHLTYKR